MTGSCKRRTLLRHFINFLRSRYILSIMRLCPDLRAGNSETKHSCPDILKKIVREILCNQLNCSFPPFRKTETTCKCRDAVENVNWLEYLFMLLDLCTNRRWHKQGLIDLSSQAVIRNRLIALNFMLPTQPSYQFSFKGWNLLLISKELWQIQRMLLSKNVIHHSKWVCFQCLIMALFRVCLDSLVASIHSQVSGRRKQIAPYSYATSKREFWLAYNWDHAEKQWVQKLI